MASDELRAAATKVLRYCDRVDGLAPLPERIDPEILFHLTEMARETARAILAEFHADDGGPVTAEWLESVGFYRPMQVAAGSLYVTRASVTDDRVWSLPVVGVEFPRHRRPDEVPVWRVWVYSHARDLNHCPTRGHVRRLLAALGVPTT